MKKSNFQWSFVLAGMAGGLIILAFVFLMSKSARPFFSLLSPNLIPPDSALLEESKIFDLADELEFQQSSMVFSPDGRQFALIASYPEGQAVILNGQTGPLFDKINFMVFSSDSQNFAYLAQEGSQERMVINGLVGSAYDWTFPPYRFSPDGRIFAYRARQGSREMAVFNNQQVSRTYDKILDIFPTPDKKGLIFFALDQNQLWRGEVRLAD